jgi:hypothetical protein
MLLPELPHQGNIAELPVAEAEPATHSNSLRLESSDKKLLDELLCGQSAKVVVEVDHRRSRNPELGEDLDAAVEAGEQIGRSFPVYHRYGMIGESHHHDGKTAVCQRAENVLMTQMDTVVDTDRHG